jgi:p-aminobenzoyl-glutamate transporter AbgT
MIWAALRIILVVHGHLLSRQMYWFLDSQRPFMLGIAVGMLVLFFVSGEAYRGVKRWRELKGPKR